ncbi:hypothetical protein OG884_07115 [Streptosporangium sp. NBC_01755]|uniref:hypothetical protein n=1 Tax=unclassified Streptosporangium TaxID=2632669 RepID=UPI002DD88B53|nr:MULTISPECIES: hypothetical protein [unclassified Streptosporangium]WSA26888.1 hypothetical protein OIE13_03035 [Streptosporangium sp. NBC_01810]WSD01687.1 hypothetical protein OG884_07115 [Streptosporangium sp. NBC_01755]
MGSRSSMAPVVASGTASVVKLLIATLAFAGAYLGVETAYGTPARMPVGQEVTAGTATRAPVRTVVLSARSMPTTTEQAPVAGTVTTEQAPVAGTVTVGAIDAFGPCDRPYLAQGVVDNDDPRAAVSYGWRLERWSSKTHRWYAYLSASSGFTGESQTVEWQPRIINNPGWYRVVLVVSGDAPLRSERFLVGC